MSNELPLAPQGQLAEDLHRKGLPKFILAALHLRKAALAQALLVDTEASVEAPLWPLNILCSKFYVIVHHIGYIISISFYIYI